MLVPCTILLDQNRCFNRLLSCHLSLKDSKSLAVLAGERCPHLDFGVCTDWYSASVPSATPLKASRWSPFCSKVALRGIPLPESSQLPCHIFINKQFCTQSSFTLSLLFHGNIYSHALKCSHCSFSSFSNNQVVEALGWYHRLGQCRPIVPTSPWVDWVGHLLWHHEQTRLAAHVHFSVCG